MARIASFFVMIMVWNVVWGIEPPRAAQQAPPAQVVVLDQTQKTVDQLTDGDRLQLRVILPQKSDSGTALAFHLNGIDAPLGSCAIPAGSDRCTTEPLDALGWYWNLDGSAQPSRTVLALEGETVAGQSAPLGVKPRPVVMVHGFSSSWQAWEKYLGPAGYLAAIGVPGFAVGDGQVPGVMNTGNIADPLGRTNTIAENAAILKQYIEGVKKLTGAQKVDLMAHSMGGLISRYYIDQVMQSRDVGQLLMLGTPQNGTECSYLPASLGFYLPASMEIRPSYVEGVFNPQITHRRGVQFYALAGIPIIEAFKSPCTAVPSDIAISLDSAGGQPVNLKKIALLHIDLNGSPQAFDDFVRPLLQKTPGAFTNEPDPINPSAVRTPQQFNKMYHGHLDAGASQEFVIPIEAGVTVASFALYDSSRTLQVQVTGASGKTIELDAVKNGLIVVDDPSSMVYLGYGFANPKMGLWKVALQTTQATPSGGADYALTARFEGGAVLDAQATPTLPNINQAVNLQATLALNGQPLPITQAQAQIRGPNGKLETVALTLKDGAVQASWKPSQAGLYGIDIEVTGQPPEGALPAGAMVERAGFLAVDVQPQEDQARSIVNLILLLGGAALMLILVVLLVLLGAKRVFRRS